ncbi:MAG: putative carotene oxygenase [Benjaminiella poitrasii]|nr:MAG: putative carotene oxygenase [Benjaminiella poitrasii]
MLTPAANNPNAKLNEAAPSPIGFKNVPSVEKPITLKVKGEIPSWVNGVMYRSGSGRYNLLLDNGDTFHIGHPFDGLAMLHRFEITNGSVKYNSRHTSHGVERRIAQRDPTLLTFGPDPCKTIFGRMQTVYHHISKFGTNAALQENDPEFDMVNVTVTPNFPLGKALESETGVKRGEALVVKRDANTLQVVDPETLKPLKMFTYAHVSKKLQGQLCASHHQYDEEADEYINFMVRLGPFPTFQTFTLGPYLPSGEKEQVAAPEPRLHQPIWRHLGAWKTLEALKPSYIHSFSMTKNYIIIPNFPYYYSFGGLSAIYYSCAYQTFYWDETRHTLFHVIDRHTGKHVATYEADPCFAFHTANAWDEEIELPGGRRERVIYMDYCMYENTDIVDASFELGKTPTGHLDLDSVQPAQYRFDKLTDHKQQHQISPAQFRRYRLGQVPVAEPDEKPWMSSWRDIFSPSKWTQFNKRRVASYEVIGYDLEMPRFNTRYNLKKYRYCYGVCESKFAPSYASGAVVNGLIKLDLDNVYLGANTDPESSAKIWDEPGCSCAEPVFVPHPDATAEDEGVIMSIVNTTLEDGSESCFLLILDAATFTELARATIGAFNAVTLHASFVDPSGRGIAVN